MDASEQKPTNHTTVLSCASYSGQRPTQVTASNPTGTATPLRVLPASLQAVLQQGHQSAALEAARHPHSLQKDTLRASPPRPLAVAATDVQREEGSPTG